MLSAGSRTSRAALAPFPQDGPSFVPPNWGRFVGALGVPREGPVSLASYARGTFPVGRADAVWRALLFLSRAIARDRALSDLGWIHRTPLAQGPIRIKLRLIAQLEIPINNGPFKTWTAAHGRSVILNARQILKVDIFQENRIKVTFSNGASEDFNATLADFESWLLAVD
jgi:hypothetical protein